ncbi:hypothetical protein ACFOYW_18080 [Gryllotalpicola reticulitermitis]|uniref:ABC transporter permease n=1 Tax=Gryllotalpicola reticulitermitis TaxID=1184153 RepID=A0ABV8QC84_9MICO
MTAVTLIEPGARSSAAHAPSASARIWRIVRLHYANRVNSLYAPLGTLASIFAVFLFVQVLIVHATGHNADSGQGYSPGLVYFLPYQVIFAVQAMNLTFAYALGMSSTRRDFALGTGLMFFLQSAGFSVICTVMSYLEQWTHGWGLHSVLFHGLVYGTGNVGERLLTFFAGIFFMLCVGSVFGAAFVRWRMNGTFVIGLALLLVFVGAAALITFTNSWLRLGNWFVAVGPAGFAAWLLLPAAIFAVIGYVALRRATPKS